MEHLHTFYSVLPNYQPWPQCFSDHEAKRKAIAETRAMSAGAVNALITCWNTADRRLQVKVCAFVQMWTQVLTLPFFTWSLQKLVLKAGTSHLGSSEFLKFHPSTLPAVHSCTQQEQVIKPSVTRRKAMLLCFCVSFPFSPLKDPI